MKSAQLILATCLLTPAVAFAQVAINQSNAQAGLGSGDAAGFPVTITQPGSYKLSSNLLVPLTPGLSIDTLSNGIEINADNVVFDMSGFSISNSHNCTKGATSGNSCIPVTATPQTLIRIHGSNVTIRNGAVFGSYGVGISIAGDGARIESVNVSKNAYDGITTEVTGTNYADAAVLQNVNSSVNGGRGYNQGANNSATVNGLVLSYNDGGAFLADGNATDILASHNATYGIRAANASVVHASAFANNGDGMSGGSVVRDSRASSNIVGFNGTNGGTGTMYVNSSAGFNTTGFLLNSNDCYSQITADTNTTNISGGVQLTGTHVTCP